LPDAPAVKCRIVAAVPLFDAARRAAFMSDLIRPLLRRPTHLLPFEAVRAGLAPAGFVERGVHDVEIAKIVGSLDRGEEFTRAFLPRHDSMRERWDEVRRLAEGPRGFPPVDLYRVGEVYFVVDGHHRISVARALGTAMIEARVREYSAPVELGPEAGPADLERAVLARARADFLLASGIAAAPGELVASEIGAYHRLLDHLATHRYFLGLDEGRDVSWAEAAASWRWTVFQPMVEAIRSSGILQDFPGRTETDLYLFTMDHLHALRQRFGPGVPPEQGVAAAPRPAGGGRRGRADKKRDPER
jgi:hypothetical protein